MISILNIWYKAKILFDYTSRFYILRAIQKQKTIPRSSEDMIT